MTTGPTTIRTIRGTAASAASELSIPVITQQEKHNRIILPNKQSVVQPGHILSNNEKEIYQRSISNSSRTRTHKTNTMEFLPTRPRQPGVRFTRKNRKSRNTRKNRKNRKSRRNSRTTRNH